MFKRVVAYCRVSSDHDDQLNSLGNQKQYWEEYITNHSNMIFCGLYVDEGITGTQILKRDGFNQMLKDAEAKKFDMIITKEVSRFARNTVDTLVHTRRLKELGIGVLFESDNIFTLDNDGELRLTIMATLAQEESRKTSQRVQWGHKRAMKNGIVFGADRILGYDLIDKTLLINEKESQIIQNIFNWFIEGESLHGIVRRLKEIGITTGKLGGKLDHSSIMRILKNEKYCGDLIQRKHYTEDFLSHKQIKNNGEIDYIIKRDNHPAIINRDIWDKVQFLLNENRKRFRDEGIGYQRHVWGSKLICICGNKFRRKVLKNKDGSDRPVWVCPSYYDKGTKGCLNKGYIREDVLENIFMGIFQNIITEESKCHFLEVCNEVYNNILSESDNRVNLDNVNKRLKQIEAKKQKLLDLYMDENSTLTKVDFNKRNDELLKEENFLYVKLKELNEAHFMVQTEKERIEQIFKTLNNTLAFKIFNGDLVKTYLDKINVDLINRKLRVYLLFGMYNIDLAKYPKRVNSGDHVPFMDIKLATKKGAFQYTMYYNVEVFMG